MASILKQRRDTEGNWEALNPVIPDGQLCFDITNNLFKIGDGINVYSALPVQSGSPGVGAYNEATGLSEGLMSISHHNKLDGIEEGAEVNALADWNSSSGDNKILNKPTIQYQSPIGSGNGKLVPALGTAGHFLKHDGSFGLPNYSPAVSTSSIPTDGATNSAISSGWAFDNVKTAVPVNALFTDTNTQLPLIDSDAMTGASAANVASAESVKAYVDSSVIANTDTQDLSISGQTLSLTNGGSVTLPDTNTQLPLIDSDTMSGALATNVASSESIKAYVDGAVIANTDTQDITISGQTLSLTNGGSVTLPDTNTQLNNAGVIGKVLTGIDVSTTADVVATDTIVAAIGKLENRVATNDDKITNQTQAVAYSSAISEGNSGLVPSVGSSGEFLKHDGTFGTPSYNTLALGTASSTALAGDTALLQLGTSSSTALAGDTALLVLGTSSSTALAGNTTLLALGTSSSTALAGNTSIISLSDSQTFTGTNQINSRKFPITSITDGDAVGDIMYIGSGTTILGRIYNLIAGTWTVIDGRAVSSSIGLLAVALGTSPTTHGMLIRGTVTLSLNLAGTDTIGGTIYVGNGATTGAATNIIPTASGYVVRVVGYSLSTGNDMVWFNPDSTYIEIA
jgi:hypothetical protein